VLVLPTRVYKPFNTISTQDTAAFQPAGRRVAVFAGLCWLYACLHLDRQVPGILAEAMKGDIGLRDQQLGAIGESTFSIVYALLGLYFGQRADRSSRLDLVRWGAWVWSLSCIGAAWAPGYVGLIASRGGVAVGEAMATAAAISLMAEISGERYRARATSVFFAFAFIGAGTAAVLGGWVVSVFQHNAALVGWRAAMIAAGLPGIVGAVYLSVLGHRTRAQGAAPVETSLQTTLLDPSAHGAAPPEQTPPAAALDQARGAHGMAPTLIAAALATVLIQMRWPAALSVPASTVLALAVAAVWTHRLRKADAASYAATLGRPEFRWLLGSFAAVLFVDFAAGFWLIPYAQRRFDVSAGSAGTQLGGLMIAGGIAGVLLGGWCADRWRRVNRAGRVWTALIAVLIEVAAILLALAQTDYSKFLVAFATFCFASGGWTGVAAAIGLDIVPRAHRGTATAAYFLVTTVLGAGLGPFVVGLCSDSSGSVGTALAWCCGVGVLAAVGLLRLGQRVATARQ
jgi:MFS family permease